jgi:hypothetical protein
MMVVIRNFVTSSPAHFVFVIIVQGIHNRNAAMGSDRSHRNRACSSLNYHQIT